MSQLPIALLMNQSELLELQKAVDASLEYTLDEMVDNSPLSSHDNSTLTFTHQEASDAKDVIYRHTKTIQRLTRLKYEINNLMDRYEQGYTCR